MANRDVPLEDDAFVVRFGLMELPDLRRAVETCTIVRGFPGLSFFGENELTAEEIALVAGRPHRWLRVTRYRRLRELGYELSREGLRNHLVLRFDRVPTDVELSGLRKVFDAPRPNPHPL